MKENLKSLFLAALITACIVAAVVGIVRIIEIDNEIDRLEKEKLKLEIELLEIERGGQP
jgi:hypothetical protein